MALNSSCGYRIFLFTRDNKKGATFSDINSRWDGNYYPPARSEN